ncbi:MAG: redoxin family protein [Candidatus Obscuribacterales bacterium]|nr:redoxin family protein [Candidatus Obscuribacterales bacterium]
MFLIRYGYLSLPMAFLLLLLSLGLCFAGELASTGVAQAVTPELTDQLLQKGGVFIFFEPSCPICAEYFPSIERLEAKYAKLDRFYLVFASQEKDAADKFIAEYHPHSAVLIDNSSQLQSRLKAKVTPQAIVVCANKIEYSGRIDDRYVSIGNRRSVVRCHDLAEALSALSQGKSVPIKSTNPVGCFLQSNQ